MTSLCKVCWFTFSSCGPWKENCTKPKRLTNVATHHFFKRFIFYITNSFSAKFFFGLLQLKPTTKPWWNKRSDLTKIGCRKRNRGQIHEWHFIPPGWNLNQQKSHWKLTLLVVYKPTKRKSLHILFQPLRFLKGVSKISFQAFHFFPLVQLWDVPFELIVGAKNVSSEFRNLEILVRKVCHTVRISDSFSFEELGWGKDFVAMGSYWPGAWNDDKTSLKWILHLWKSSGWHLQNSGLEHDFRFG